MSWDEYADGWDDDPAVQSYAKAAFQSLQGLAGSDGLKLHGARALDFGCGTGLLTTQIASAAKEVVGLDMSSAMIRVLDQKIQAMGLTNLQTFAGSIEQGVVQKTELFGAPFDLVTCSSVCAFVDDYPATVRTLTGLLQKGGAFVQWDWELEEHADESFGFTQKQIEETLSGAGLTQVQARIGFDVEFEGKRMRPLLGFGVK